MNVRVLTNNCLVIRLSTSQLIGRIRLQESRFNQTLCEAFLFKNTIQHLRNAQRVRFNRQDLAQQITNEGGLRQNSYRKKPETGFRIPIRGFRNGTRGARNRTLASDIEQSRPSLGVGHLPFVISQLLKSPEWIWFMQFH